jgi:hypothetical protein
MVMSGVPELDRNIVQNMTLPWVTDKVEKWPTARLLPAPVTTLIAAHKTGRKGWLIELDPKYCDVIVRHWQEWTGESAARV